MRAILVLVFFFYVISLAKAVSFVPKTFSSSYEETFKSLVTGKEKKSKGSLSYQYPKRIRLEKKDSLFISNKDTTWFYTPPFLEGEEGQVVIQSSANLPLMNLLDVLHQGLEENRFYVTHLQTNGIVIKFKKSAQKIFKLEKAELLPQKDFKLKSLGFDQVSQIKLYYLNGQVIEIKLTGLKLNRTFAADYFVFKKPENTKVIKQ